MIFDVFSEKGEKFIFERLVAATRAHHYMF